MSVFGETDNYFSQWRLLSVAECREPLPYGAKADVLRTPGGGSDSVSVVRGKATKSWTGSMGFLA